MSSPISSNVSFWIACALIASLGLWLAWPDEIVAQPNPYDQLRYLEMAEEIAAGHWLGEFTHMTLVREPAYPVWLALVHESGVPLRLANELLLLAAAGLLAGALVRSGVPATLGVASFAIFALQPHGFLSQRELLPASLYAVLHLVVLAGVLLMGAARSPVRWVHMAWTGLALGVLWTARPERPLIAGWVLTLAALELLRVRARSGSMGTGLVHATSAVVMWSAGIALVAGSLAGLNYRHYGVFRTADPNGAGFLAANRALASIAHDTPRRFVPVPSDVRQRAYAASPAFAALRPVLEGPSWARGVSCKLDKVCDDIGAGYFRWLLREAAAESGRVAPTAGGPGSTGGGPGSTGGGPTATASEAALTAAGLDGRLMQIAVELDAACDSGALPCRESLSGFLHPYAETYLPHLAASLEAVIGRIATTGGRRDRWPPRDAPDLARPLRDRFDALANRRSERTHFPLDRLAGRLHAPTDGIVAARADVDGQRVPVRLQAAGASGWEFSFAVEQPVPRQLARYPILELDRESGSTTRIPLPPEGESAQADGVSLSVEHWQHGIATDAAQQRVRSLLWTAHGWLARVLAPLSLAAAGILLWPPWRGRFANPVFVAIAAMVAAVIARVALLALIDASSFPARSSRYVYPIASLYGCAALLLIHQAWLRVRAAASTRRAAT